jgi:hypothetical protein
LIGSRETPRYCHCRPVEGSIPLADGSQGHVDRLLDEMTVIGCGALDQLERLKELGVIRDLVVDGKAPDQRKRRPFDELFPILRPLLDLAPRVRGAIEQDEAQGVADSPIVEIAAPLVHLGGGHAGGLVNVCRKKTRFVPAAPPQPLREIVTVAELLGEALYRAD